MARKIIQIAAVPSTEDSVEAVYALCDDGTVWVRAETYEAKWEQIEPVPQEEQTK